jgi:hypothetical protein
MGIVTGDRPVGSASIVCVAQQGAPADDWTGDFAEWLGERTVNLFVVGAVVLFVLRANRQSGRDRRSRRRPRE